MIRVVTIYAEPHGGVTRCVVGLWTPDFMAWLASKGRHSSLRLMEQVPVRSDAELIRARHVVAQFLMRGVPACKRLSEGPL